MLLLGTTAASPFRAARAAACASMVSVLPQRRRICRFGRFTSVTSTPTAVRCRARPACVRAGALDPDTHHGAEGPQPPQQMLIAAGISPEHLRAQQPVGRIQRRCGVDLFVSVDPAEIARLVLCLSCCIGNGIFASSLACSSLRAFCGCLCPSSEVHSGEQNCCTHSRMPLSIATSPPKRHSITAHHHDSSPTERMFIS